VAIPTLFGVATIVFFIVRLIPGDPARVMAGESAGDDVVERIRANLGFDQPLPIQYARFLLSLLRADLGRSIRTGDSAFSEIMLRLPHTLELAVLATVLGAAIGITLGIVAATNHGRLIDVVVSALSVSGMSLPTYWLGLMLVIVFAVNLRWLPASGAEDPRGVILPTVTLAALSTALIARMSRSAMLEVLGQEYVRTARAKGVSNRRVLLGHCLPNALLPIVTVIALQFGALLGGAVLTETIFSWPGMGRLLVDSIFARDYPVVQGCVLLFSVGFIVVNLFADLLYAVVDPRIRY
jgi:ABC-type dipeptide/oligopeptide/nickel transport system permease component